MQKKILPLLLGTLSLVAVTAHAINDIEPGKEYYTALRTTNVIVLDGSLADWPAAPVLADPKFANPKYSATNDSPTYVLFEEYNDGIWTGPDDQTSAVQIIYDADNVYFGFVVTDDYHENAANSPWNGDSIQLMIANAARDTEIALYNYALGGVEGALGQVIVEHERPVPPPGVTEAVVTRDGVNKKTYYEIKLPVAALGLTGPLTNGTQFGLGMAINDGDLTLAGQLNQAGQKGWGGLGAHAIVHLKTPSETALITLGTTVSGTDRLFLSAINPGILTFSFRANDKGASIVDPATARLIIDGQTNTPTASPRVGDAIDFTYNRPTPFAPGNHTYSIEVRDGIGNVVTDSGSFLSASVLTLTAAHKAVSVDTNQPGFIWRVFQNETEPPTTLAQAELALAGQWRDSGGQLLPNLADTNAIGIASAAGTVDGPLMKFEIPTVINLSEVGGDLNGAFTPDDQMPGIPGINASNDGIDAEIITFVEFPAGLITMGVRSDDGFRTQAGYINSPADGLVLGQSEVVVANAIFRFFVQDAGIYPLRTIYQENVGFANIEWFTRKADGNTVLLNDTNNGGFKTYRVGVAPNKSTAFPVAIQRPGGQLEITWTEPGVVLQESINLINWTDLTAEPSPYRPTTGPRPLVFYRLKK